MTVFLVLGGLTLGTDLSADQRLLVPSPWQGFWATGTRNHLMSITWIALPRCEPMSTRHAPHQTPPLLPGPGNPELFHAKGQRRTVHAQAHRRPLRAREHPFGLLQRRQDQRPVALFE